MCKFFFLYKLVKLNYVPSGRIGDATSSGERKQDRAPSHNSYELIFVAFELRLIEFTYVKLVGLITKVNFIESHVSLSWIYAFGGRLYPI